MCICINTYLYKFIHIWMYKCTYVHIHIYIGARTAGHEDLLLELPSGGEEFVYIYTYMYICRYMYMYAYMYVYRYIRVHLYIFLYMCMYVRNKFTAVNPWLGAIEPLILTDLTLYSSSLTRISYSSTCNPHPLSLTLSPLGDEFTAVKPWLGAIVAPSAWGAAGMSVDL
jgi:hypothetical protein